MKTTYKSLSALLLALVLMLSLTACGGASSDTSAAQSQPETQQTEKAVTEDQSQAETDPSDASVPEQENSETVSAQAEPETTSSGKDVLVVYFSATGTTKGVAEQIAAITDADIYEIKAAQEYTSDDLNWNDSDSRSTKEQNDPSARPEIGSDTISLEDYSTIYIGYPIWWGEEPRIMDTFVESYRFDGITMIPFCTSSSSGIGRSGQNLADNAGSGTWLDGQRFGAGVSDSELQAWIDGLQ